MFLGTYSNMPYQVKFGWPEGYELCHTDFQPNGNGRGMPNQHLPEVRPTGYYRDTPATDLVVGDVVLVYRRENMEYEDSPMSYLDYADMYYEGVQLQHEGEYMKDYDTTESHLLIWIGDPIGIGEYDDLIGTTDSIDDLTIGQTTVFNTYDEREGAGGDQVITSTGRLTVEGGDC